VAALARDLALEVFLLRPFYAYGPGDPANRLVPAVIRMASGGGPIRTTDGRQVRDFVHVEDVARAFLLAARARWPGGTGDHRMRVVNVGTGRPTPLWKVIERIAVLCRRDPGEIQLGAIPHRANEMWRLVADTALAEEVLGWRPRIGLEEGLAATVAHALGSATP
jgi:nucleoside-diphosphate-sugar epimerase